MTVWDHGLHFFAYDDNNPLESLKKFILGELPDLDAASKKEPTKRKNESRSGLPTKKTKTDLTAIIENQEKLKNCRQNFLDSIPEKQGLGNSLINNPILDKAGKFKEIMSKPDDRNW